jgi:hypothetical protein
VQSRWKLTWPGALALVLLALCLARTARQLARDPAWNWDLVPAMALALEWSEDDPAEVHRRTYALAQAELAPEVFATLVAPGVRQARARDAAAFREHLPFYRGRVLYTLLLAGLHGLGAPLAHATWWISLASWFGLAALALVWTARHLPLWAAALATLGLAHLPALLAIARFSTADALGTLLVCVGAYALVERRSFAWFAGLLALALAARPDTAILIGCAAAALVVLVPRSERHGVGVLAGWVALCAGVTLALGRFAGEYGWWPLMQISFVGKAVHPAELPTAVDWGEYLAILGRQLASLPGGGYVQTPSGEVTGSSLVVLWLALAGLGLARALRDGMHVIAALLAALLAAYLLRYLLFPQTWDRFYAPLYVLVPLCLLALARPRSGAPMPALAAVP